MLEYQANHYFAKMFLQSCFENEKVSETVFHPMIDPGVRQAKRVETKDLKVALVVE
jgi:hypothetical protein